MASPGYDSYAAALPPVPRREIRASRSRMPLIITLAVIGVVLFCGGSGLALFAYGPSIDFWHSGPVASGATPTVEAGTTPTPTNNVFFQDPMTSNDNGWPVDPGRCFFGSDGYHVAGATICYAPIGQMVGFDFSTDVQQIAGPTTWFYGIVFRRVSKGNYYQFGIDSNGKWDMVKVVDDNAAELIPYAPNTAIKTGLNATNTLEGEASARTSSSSSMR
jgi:hypothetical protein